MRALSFTAVRGLEADAGAAVPVSLCSAARLLQPSASLVSLRQDVEPDWFSSAGGAFTACRTNQRCVWNEDVTLCLVSQFLPAGVHALT
ncbi:unnamed protein product [Pleuronectes platessa]|uniref:Uncharacterized protein n=1 Tax=Pleuronectes platessa TaxID=8262 RepID=A0A9N7UXA6_PLEPL|nr:unnamed protein product [Pleuronectes platessa]